MPYCMAISIQSANRTSRFPADLSELGLVRANGSAETEWTWETQPKQGTVFPWSSTCRLLPRYRERASDLRARSRDP